MFYLFYTVYQYDSHKVGLPSNFNISEAHFFFLDTYGISSMSGGASGPPVLLRAYSWQAQETTGMLATEPRSV